MKQVRTLLMAAATLAALAAATLAVPAAAVGLLLQPSSALAQPRPKAPVAKPGSGAKPGAAAVAPPAGAPAGGTDIDLDEKPAGVAVPTPTPEAPTGDAPTGGICDIDPSACPKAIDVRKAADNPLVEDVKTVQQIYALRAHRLEVSPYFSFSLNDQFVSHPGPGLSVNYYLSNVLAIGASANYYGPLNSDSDFNFQNRRAARVATPLSEYLLGANFNMTYVPVYGKFAGFSEFIFHYDLYVVGGVGVIWNRPIAVVDPDNRKFDWKPDLSILNPGIGLRIFFNRWFAANLELRDYIFIPKTENLTVASTDAQKRSSGTWYGPTEFTNNIQAQIGVSFFIPPSWEYKLPK
jgi:outer membrane beta-barrel protein